MNRRYYLGIDLGSGSVKVVLIDDNGVLIASENAEYPTHYPTPGAAEQNPEDWYAATCEATQRVLAQHPVSGSVDAIGLSGTSHAPILMNDDKGWIRPAILWNDGRSEVQVRTLAAAKGKTIECKTGNAVSCTWALPQILWIKENEPDRFEAATSVLFTKDYLAYRLTGQYVSDVTSAYSSLFVESETLEWNDELLSLSGISHLRLPRILSSTDTVGTLTMQAARDLGLPRHVRVMGGAIDSAAELVGVGATSKRVAVIRLGSAGGVMTIGDAAILVPGCLLYPHLVNGAWYHQAGTNSATTSLNWVMRLFGLGDGPESYETVDTLVGEAPVGADGLVFHPYLLGERAPYWSNNLKGGYNGLGLTHQRSHFVRAVMEGVAFSLKDGVNLLDWSNVGEIKVCGGGAKSAAWCQIIGDVLGLPVSQAAQLDASGYGAALIAMAGAQGEGLEECSLRLTDSGSYIEPVYAHNRVYTSLYDRYRRLSSSMLEIYRS